MEQKVMLFVFAICIATASCSLYKKAEKPKGMADDLYCIGCQLVIKELDFILSQSPTRGMGETVTRALRVVCDEANFKKYEYNAKRIATVCKAMKVDEGLEAVLIKKYGQKHELGIRIIANDLGVLICGTVVKACPEQKFMDVNEEDGGLKYDAETNDFFVKDGSKVRHVKPVREGDQPRQHERPQKPHPDVQIDESLMGHDEL